MLTTHGARLSNTIMREEMRQAALGLWSLPDEIAVRGVVVAAHPDDEVIGVGARLQRWPDVNVVYVTDGAPRNMRDAAALKLPTRDAYAAVRRAERSRALALAGVSEKRIHDLGRVDQEASFDLVGISTDLFQLLRAIEPDVVVTHPYEGGHPDHDATAFAVHAAVELLGADGAPRPAIVEMTSYHRGVDGIATGCFLPSVRRPAYHTALWGEVRAIKRRMLACHTSQRAVLRAFRCDVEPIRIAPDYDFGSPPHAGPLHYEHFDWGLDGAAWRARALEASRALAIDARTWRAT